MKKLSMMIFSLVFAFTTLSIHAQSNDNLNTQPAKKDAESTKLLKKANAAFSDGDFSAAIPLFESLLEREDRKRTLERKPWIGLINNLSIAYVMSGDIRNARSVLEYGISKEPTYPVFYYNNACGYAEDGDEENAIKNLRLAFKYKDNSLDKEPMPDPEMDDSFKELLKSEKFRKALAEMKAAK